MVFPVVGGTQDAEFNVSNSARFDDGSSDRLYFDQGSGDDTTARRKWTFSTWIKRSEIESSNHEYFFGAGDYTLIGFRKDDSGEADDLYIQSQNSGTATALQTNAKFRDTNAWYHIFARFDSTQGSASNRLVAYVNGVEVGSNYGDYSVDQRSSITQNEEDLEIGDSGTRISIGYSPNGTSSFFDGYMAETHLLIGSAKAHTDFGETNDNGVWVPIKTSFASSDYGTNGFKLEYKQTGTSANSSGIGADTSGNDNHFTVQNLNAQNVTTDTPTNNFNTLNPLVPHHSIFDAETEGNTGLSSSGVELRGGYFGTTIMPSNGKWYFEVKILSTGSSDRTGLSIVNFESVVGDDHVEGGDYKGFSISTGTLGRVFVTNGSSTAETDISGYQYSDDDIAIFAVDMDASTPRVYVGKNGTWFTTSAATGGNPASDTGYFETILGNHFSVGARHSAGTSTSQSYLYNFGQPAFSISSGNADANGYGNFEYAPPSGYYAICTKNLAEYG